MQQKNPLVLIILDGWGYSPNSSHNAIFNAKKPQWDAWWDNCPHMLIDTSGDAVGLPDNQMGNSEVGHMHIGAGRKILQSFSFINESIANNDFNNNPVFIDAINNAQQKNSAIHVMGLLSCGGVHSHQNHLFAFIRLCAQKKFNNIFLHLFLDGRDTAPQSALKSIEQLQEAISLNQSGAIISTISGRYYAMDRDHRFERTKAVYDLLVDGKSEKIFKSATDAIEYYYSQGIYDEFILPTKIGSSPNIKNEDTVFFFNFRADRARQLTQAFIDEDFNGFQRATKIFNLTFISMTQYSESFKNIVAFAPRKISNTLGEVIANHNLSQLRIAETEKYAHVTFFLNGGREVVFNKEDRILIPSPNVATYDLQPEMSGQIITDRIIEAIKNNMYDVIICNYANADMVGHSGNYQATITAIEALDKFLQELGQVVLDKNGEILITADHGNAECMFDEEINQPHTAHTSDPVPLLYVGHKKMRFKKELGNLADIAPTILALLNITPPQEMTGEIMLENIE